jgi:hypothetical protein
MLGRVVWNERWEFSILDSIHSIFSLSFHTSSNQPSVNSCSYYFCFHFHFCLLCFFFSNPKNGNFLFFILNLEILSFGNLICKLFNKFGNFMKNMILFVWPVVEVFSYSFFKHYNIDFLVLLLDVLSISLGYARVELHE